MKDPYQEMMEEAMALAFGMVAIFVVFFAQGCATTVKHEVPQLDSLGATMKQIVIEDCKKPTLAMPPIPMECVIDVRGDVLTASSQECEDLLRFYVQARSLLKPAAPLPAAQPAR
jgi:hypothetical protein